MDKEIERLLNEDKKTDTDVDKMFLLMIINIDERLEKIEKLLKNNFKNK